MKNTYINLDYQSRVPIYEQIVNSIEKYVAVGIIKAKEQIPSIRDLAGSLGVNPNTIKKAYDELEKRGIISSMSTKGTFISDNINYIIKQKIDQDIKNLNNQIKELTKLGITREEIIKRLEK